MIKKQQAGHLTRLLFFNHEWELFTEAGPSDFVKATL
jgi:hypothetical protein